jgi:Ribonuclease G/E
MPKNNQKETIIHSRIGENVFALVENGKIAEIRINIQGLSKTRIGHQFCARVKSVDPRLSAAFIDLGEEQALLPFKGKRPAYLTEGKALLVEITREAFEQKLATAAYFGDAKSSVPCPSIIKDIPEYGDWNAPTPATQEQAEKIEHILLMAGQKTFPLKNGGNIAIERTRALTTIDIDASGRIAGGSNQINFNHKLNKEAAFEIARLIRLYNLSGLIVVDFVGAPYGDSAKELVEILQGGLKTNVKCEILALSKFGLCEINRARKGISITEICATPQQLAINAINALARNLENSKGRVIELRINEIAFGALQNWSFGWQKHLEEKVGGRFNISPSNIDEYEII